MAQYQTGTAASPTALKTIIEIFCTDNGFSLASDWLSKNQSHINLHTRIPATISGISRSGTLATVTVTGSHRLTTGDTITISGATDSLYNGTFSVTVTAPSTFTYVMGGTPAASPATGTLVASGDPRTLSIQGANSADGLTELAPYSDRIRVELASWPITYYLFYSGTPDQVCCAIQHDVTKVQHIMFGEISKVHSSAFVGGNWYYATKGINTTAISSLLSISDTGLSTCSVTGTGQVVPFPLNGSSLAIDNTSGRIHCKVDSTVWTNGILTTAVQGQVFLTDYTRRSLFRSPNTWNSQALLVPMHLKIRAASTLDMYLGYIEHVRLVRIDNYDLGDIITLGSDQWKVFPCLEKNSATRNGDGLSAPTNQQSGTLGYAIRYVP